VQPIAVVVQPIADVEQLKKVRTVEELLRADAIDLLRKEKQKERTRANKLQKVWDQYRDDWAQMTDGVETNHAGSKQTVTKSANEEEEKKEEPTPKKK